MSYPILYSSTETNFDHNGIGILSACVSCEVTEEANGIFELAMTYPMDGIHYENIAERAIIKAKADQFRQPQLFRVYAISKPMNGIVTVLAEHISYDLSGIPVKPFSASTASSALIGLKNNAVVNCPFDFWTDKSTSANFKVSVPASIRSRLGGVAGSILDVYGGEYEFDNYVVKLHNNRGMNRGVSIRYGKNLTDIKQEENCSSVATGVYPYWAGTVGEKDVLVELPEKIVNAPGTYNFVKIRTLDLSSEFETQPTVDQLRSKTQNYIKANNIGVPSVSLMVSFAQLEQTEEYKHLKLLERVSLFDTVNVEFPALGVSATAKAVKMVYDVIADRVKSVTLGSVRANIADTIADQKKEISSLPGLTDLQKASAAVTASILGAAGGAVRFLDENGDGMPDTLYIADNADPALAVKVWRFNYAGWGASQTGYNGPFTMGATLTDGFVADFITAGTLNAALVKVINLIVDHLVSTLGTSTLEIDGAMLKLTSNGSDAVKLSNAAERKPIMYMTGLDANGDEQRAEYAPHMVKVGGTSASPKVLIDGTAGNIKSGTGTPIKVEGIEFSRTGLRSLLAVHTALLSGVSYGTGSTFNVSGAGNYRLFAINMSDSAKANSSIMVLAYYKTGKVCGIGGGAQTDGGLMYAVSCDVTGDGLSTWKVENAVSHTIASDGTVQGSVPMYIHEIIGIV